MTDPKRLRAVLDTNVLLASLLSRNPNSPTVELIVRWRNGEFDLLYSPDTLAELEGKLIDKGIDPELGELFIADLLGYGLRVEVSSADVIPVIKQDPDDDLILACAEVGQATHLVTYDPHFDVLGEEYHGIQMVDALSFLYFDQRGCQIRGTACTGGLSPNSGRAGEMECGMLYEYVSLLSVIASRRRRLLVCIGETASSLRSSQ